MALQVRIRRLRAEAQRPAFAHGPHEDAGLDLVAAEAVYIPPHTWAAVSTGLAIELPPGYEGQVRPRSGLAARHGLGLLNSPGTIDPSYRGEIRVLLINHSGEPYQVRVGDRIAQLVVARYEAVECEWSDDLEDSSRGEDGFGSTGL